MAYPSIDEPPRDRQRLRGVNIPRLERAASALAGAALAAIGLRRRGVLGGLLAGVGTALIARGVTGRSAAYRGLALRHGVDIERSIVVRRSRHEVYAALRDLRRTPRFMSHIVSVQEHGATADWIAEVGPIKLEWTSEIIQELPDLRLAWRSIPGGDIQHVGVIDLEDAPDGPGTLITLALRFEPPAGAFAAPLRGFLRTMTRAQLATDLIRLRELLEAAEPRVANGHSHGNGHRRLPPFQPFKAEA